MKAITPLVVSLALAATLTVQSALHAQQLPIQPAADGTGTIVNPAGNTFNITGGTTSSSGANLFQSFTSFGLSNGQVANFLSAPNTQNILSRVTGGSFSLIDGLLKVTGSNANLFLVNPSGIIFGPNASLNVPAAFTATTANGIAFGSQWFNALGQNDYASLNGSPSTLGFTMSKPGAIINAGNLSVGPGQALSLIGGTVASNGQLSGGQVTLAAVPGEHYVRLGQPGSPLSIEVPISGAQIPTNWDLPIYSLPELLTGTGAGLTVADDGTIQLVGSQLTVENGDVVARKIDAESAVLSASRNVTLPESQLETTKDLLIQAKDTVTARDSKENPVLVKAGGNLTIQGDKSIDLLALNHPGQAFQSGGDLRLISDGNVSGDAHFGSGGKFSIETLTGKPGNFVSLYDPIISSGNDVLFGDYTGVSLKVESGGSITGGNITINGPDTSGNLPGNDPDFATLTTSSALILRAGFTSGNLTLPGTITVASLDTGGNVTTNGAIILEAPGNIAISGSVNAGNITVNTPGTATFNSSVLANNLTTDAGGLTILNGNVTTAGDQTYNDNVLINSLTLASTGNGSIFFGGSVDAGNTGNLTVNTLGTTTFNNRVVANNLTTDAGGLTVLNGNVTTEGDQTYKDNVQLNSSLTLDSLTFGNVVGVISLGNGSISFGGTVNSQPGATNSLAVITNGNVTLDGPVGNTQPLGNLTVYAGGDSNIILAGIGTPTQAGVTGNTDLQAPVGAVILGGNTYNANTQNYLGSIIAVNAGSTAGTGANTTFTASSDPIAFKGPIALYNGMTIVGASTIDTSSIDGTSYSSPINFTASNNIKTGNIATNGESIALTSLGGTITAGTINSSNGNGGGAPITLTHQGKAFIVNGSPVDPNAFSSSGTISSRSNNVISSGFFTGDFYQVNKDDKGRIAIIGPPIPILIPPCPTCPIITVPPIFILPHDPVGQDPTLPKNNIPISLITDPSTPISTNEPYSTETVRAFEKYFEQSFNMEQLPIAELRDNLRRIETASGKKLSIINVDVEAKVLTLITSEDNTIVAIPRNVTSEALREKAALLRNEIADPSNVTSNRYLKTSRQLYGWLIAPLEKYLQEKKIDTLIFQLDAGLRLMPLAALNDGQHFLVEKYSLSLIPSINLLDTHYEPERVRSSKVLAMGATTFKDDIPLPAVPPELQNVSQYGGSVFLNDNFTLSNLRAKTGGFGLIHLATHADFNRGKVQNSYIKLNDTRLSLNQMRDLGWNQQNVELLVLSACRTAVGDVNTELGFAGLAVGAGVKTAVATLWISSDIGTFGLMSEFYNDLKTASIKADALRSAQVAMLRGEVRIENGQLRVKKNTFPLPADLKALGEVRLTHPYYWSGFTMIGSPW
jgi:filamentous hemagglutinin family protein